MKINEMRDLPTAELQRELAETTRAIFNLRFQRETERLEKPAELRKAKKHVARIKTLLGEPGRIAADTAGEDGGP